MSERKLLSIKRNVSDEPKISERLQKVLAGSGVASRRDLEERISRGEVKVNGEVAVVGAQVSAGDRIEVAGHSFVVKQAPGSHGRVIIYNKLDGEVTTRHDPEGRPTVFDKLPRIKGARWISIGRLDINTQGLLIFTSNGDLAHRLMHPASGFERQYVCRVFGEVTDDMIEHLLKGIELEDGPARFLAVERLESAGGSNEWLQVTIGEGRNREVRRMFESLGVEVSRLKRIKYGPFELPKGLHRGELAELSEEDVNSICTEAGLGNPTPVLSAVDERERLLRRNRPNEIKPEGPQKRLRAERSYLGYLGGQYVGDETGRDRGSILPPLEKPGKRGKKKRRGDRGDRGDRSGPEGASQRTRPGGGRGRPRPNRPNRPARPGAPSSSANLGDAQPKFDYNPITGTFSQATGKPGRSGDRNRKPRGKGQRPGSPEIKGLFKSDAGYTPPRYATAIDPETGEIDGNRAVPELRDGAGPKRKRRRRRRGRGPAENGAQANSNNMSQGGSERAPESSPSGE